MTALELGAGDVISAAVELLEDVTLDDAIDLLEATGDRIYGHELPASESQSMPRAVVVVSEAGGFTEGLPAVADRARLDVRAYGATLDEAKALAVLVATRMRRRNRYAATNGVLLHPASRSGGFIPLREDGNGWPFVLRSYLQPYDVRALP